MSIDRHAWRQTLAEALGTYALVFAGTGAVIVNDMHSGVITHLGIALTFGLTLLSLILALGDLSGCHLNPAVTVGMVFARGFPLPKAMLYLVGQSAGAIAASCTLLALFPSHPTLGSTVPTGSVSQSFVFELLATFVLMLTILLRTANTQADRGWSAAAIAAVVACAALVAGPISGASLNPARSLGPAVVSGTWTSFWLYCVAPSAGALGSVLICRILHPGDSCCAGRCGSTTKLPEVSPQR